jgi:hypothetical protein
MVGRTGFEPVTHGLKALRSTRFYLRKLTFFEFCDTSATLLFGAEGLRHRIVMWKARSTY